MDYLNIAKSVSDVSETLGFEFESWVVSVLGNNVINYIMFASVSKMKLDRQVSGLIQILRKIYFLYA